MNSDEDLELLRRVNNTEDFFRSVLLEDDLHDWSLAKDFGDFLVRVTPDELVSHLVLVKACRHLGDLQRAAEELDQCLAVVASGTVSPIERELLLPVLEAEERLLSSGG